MAGRNYFLFCEYFITYGTFNSVGKTCCCTCCGSTSYCYFGMSKFVNCLSCSANFVATFRTFYYAVIRTCRFTSCSNFVFSNCFCRSMIKLVDCFLFCEYFITYGTFNSVGKTILCTCCVLAFYCFFSVSKFVNYLSCSANFVSTFRTFYYTVIRTCRFTSCSNFVFSNCFCRSMIKLVDCFLFNECLITY